jgi:hypothetical protein
MQYPFGGKICNGQKLGKNSNGEKSLPEKL